MPDKKYSNKEIIIALIAASLFTVFHLAYYRTPSLYTAAAFVLGALSTFFYLRSEQIYTKIFVGMIAGAVFGFVFGKEPSALLLPVGSIFLNLIKMVVVPLVFISLTMGVLSLGDPKKLGRIGSKTIGFYLITTALAITIGLVLANALKPGARMSQETKEKYIQEYEEKAAEKSKGTPEKSLAMKIGKAVAGSMEGAKDREQFINKYKKHLSDPKLFPAPQDKTGIVQQLINIVPTNPLRSMVVGDMLQVIFFALLLGLALAVIADEKRDVIQKGLDGLNDAMIKIVIWVMMLAPFGVFALLAKTVAEAGVDVLQALGFYAIVVLLGLFLHIAIVYSFIIRFVVGMPIFTFLAKIRSVQMFAFSTSSSSATLPITMRCAEDELGVQKSTSSFVLPLGATINMDGTALYQGVAAVFIAQVYGMNLDLGGQLTILLTATLASIGAAGVPGVGIVTLAMVLDTVGIPQTGLALILGVDRLLDMCRTTVNVTGDLSATLFVDATEKKYSQKSSEIKTPEESATM